MTAIQPATLTPHGVTPHPQVTRLQDGTFCPHALLPRQVEQLLRAVAGSRVARLPSGSKASYVAQHDIRAHLTRIFGFGFWGDRVTFVHGPIFDEWEDREVERKVDGEKQKVQVRYWRTGYIVGVDLWIRCPECGAVITSYGDLNGSGNAWQPDRADAHTLAVTSAHSTALKRCAINLGDQFGLSLYNKGDVRTFVKGTLNHPPLPTAEGGGTAQQQALEDVEVTGEVDELGGDALVPDAPTGPAGGNLSERGEQALAAILEWRDEADPTARITGVADLKTIYADVLEEYADDGEGNVLALARIADLAAQGRLKS